MTPEIAIMGYKGVVGSALMRALPGAVGFDLPEVDLRHQLPDLSGSIRTVISAAGCANPEAPFSHHMESVRIVMNVIQACVDHGIPNLTLASSSWAGEIQDDREQTQQTKFYGSAKRAAEELVRSYPWSGKVVRIGWFPARPLLPDDPQWLKALYLDEEALVDLFLR